MFKRLKPHDMLQMTQWLAQCPDCAGNYRDNGDYYVCDCDGEDGNLDPRDIQSEWDETHTTINGYLTITRIGF